MLTVIYLVAIVAEAIWKVPALRLAALRGRV